MRTKPLHRGARHTSAGVARAEFEELRAIVEQSAATAERNRAEHEIEFKRMAQLQAQVDELSAAIRRLIGMS